MSVPVERVGARLFNAMFVRLGLAGVGVFGSAGDSGRPVTANRFAGRPGRPPLGPVNGLVYWLQQHHPSSLYDIVSGNNRYDRHVPGYRAHRGYDLASGVGVPRFNRIAGIVPAPGR
jgi:hypothetical protein